MAALNDRLKAIADNIEKGQTMADIGSDHGFLPLYLAENGVCPEIIVTDISRASLAKAKTAFVAYTGVSAVDFRVGDGLCPLREGEADVVVIAGMGGLSITRILEADISKTLTFGKYIFQPRSGAGKLRYWLEAAEFSIIAESLAAEGKFICEVIAAIPPRAVTKLPSLNGYNDEIMYEVPSDPRACDDELYIKFLNKKLNIENNVFKSMISGKIDNTAKLDRTSDRIKFLKERLGRL